ncbi:unnamed protein product [Linum trigynum]|uniref:Secreted protein n=1 Tax=Linum trigynum TaxID=586398 RepID=A0AAV2CH72_9ROSI
MQQLGARRASPTAYLPITTAAATFLLRHASSSTALAYSPPLSNRRLTLAAFPSPKFHNSDRRPPSLPSLGV